MEEVVEEEDCDWMRPHCCYYCCYFEPRCRCLGAQNMILILLMWGFKVCGSYMCM